MIMGPWSAIIRLIHMHREKYIQLSILQQDKKYSVYAYGQNKIKRNRKLGSDYGKGMKRCHTTTLYTLHAYIAHSSLQGTMVCAPRDSVKRPFGWLRKPRQHFHFHFSISCQPKSVMEHGLEIPTLSSCKKPLENNGGKFGRKYVIEVWGLAGRTTARDIVEQKQEREDIKCQFNGRHL